VCWSVLQCVAVCCSMLQCAAVCWCTEDSQRMERREIMVFIGKKPKGRSIIISHYGDKTSHHSLCVLQCVAVCCSVLQCVGAQKRAIVWRENMPSFFGVCCSVLQCVAVCCSVLQCVAVCCSVLKCVAVCWCTCLHSVKFSRTQ